MVESKVAADLVRTLAATGSVPELPPGLSFSSFAELAGAQGLSGVLLRAAEADPERWPADLLHDLAAARRRRLVRALGQVRLARHAVDLLAEREIRALPLKGAVLAETVYDLESDRPMSDVDVLALERWPDAVAALREAGFVEVDHGDHAWAFAEPSSRELLELHRSVTSCPGLFPLDAEGLWQRSRPGRGQISRLPSAEDLLVQLALHAAFQHALVLSLVQWLDFRRVLEREPIGTDRLFQVAAEASAGIPLAAALLAAEAIVGAPLPPPLRDVLRGSLPRGLRRWLEPRLAEPLAFTPPRPAEHGRVRWKLVRGPGRRAELVWRTLFVPEGPDGRAPLAARLRRAALRARRFWSLARGGGGAPAGSGAGAPGAGVSPPPPEARPAGPRPEGGASGSARRTRGKPTVASRAAAAVGEVPFREDLVRECLASFPWVRLSVTGRCMRPRLDDGDRVHLVHAGRRPPRIGDVVLSRGPDGLKLHRLVWGPPLALPGTRWRTKADRGRLLDPPLEPDDVLATVVAVERRPRERCRRAGLALASLAGAALARLRLGVGTPQAEALP
jgi:hypothetical protein